MIIPDNLQKSIPLFYPQKFEEEWLQGLSSVFASRWLGQGPIVDRFEAEFGKKFGYDYCLAVNSGTAALELAYHLIGIGPGDEVITTVFTCTATNIPLLRRGAKIIFADINDNLLINYADVLDKVNPATKAIVVVNLGGLSVYKGIFEVAKSLGIPVVVDAAQSLGVSEPYGDYVCYSFQAIKHFTTGDGGMLVVRDKSEYDRAKKLRWFGIDREAKKKAGWRCVVNHQMAMEIEEAGYKYHMNDIAATMGLVGLRHSDEILDYRIKLGTSYATRLDPSVKIVYGGSCWLFGVILDGGRSEVMENLRSNGIECDPVQLRNDVFKIFGGWRQNLPNMDRLEDKYLYLPFNSQVTTDDIDYIAETLCQKLY